MYLFVCYLGICAGVFMLGFTKGYNFSIDRHNKRLCASKKAMQLAERRQKELDRKSKSVDLKLKSIERMSENLRKKGGRI